MIVPTIIFSFFQDVSDKLLKVAAHFTAKQFIQSKMSELCIGTVKS